MYIAYGDGYLLNLLITVDVFVARKRILVCISACLLIIY